MSVSWSEGWRAGHARLFPWVALLAALAGTFAPGAAQVAILAVAAALALPHGAFDLPLAFRRLGMRGMPAFAVGYVGIALLALLAFIWLPWPTMVLFLAFSALHFGEEDGGRAPLPVRLARGALPLAAIVAFHPMEAARIFAWTLPNGVAVGSETLRWAAGGALVAAVATLLASGRREAWFEEMGILALAAFAPPLVAFAVYFAGAHAFRHSLGVAGRLDPTSPRGGWSRFASLAAPASLATLVLAAFAVWVLTREGAAFGPATVRTTFLGLACLTFPHMALERRS